jgi:hypothetical protein
MPSSAAALRLKIESTLESRIPAALTPVPRVSEMVPTDIPEIDALLDGGLPVGAISEIIGAQSSGRTSLALATLARRTQDEQVCAWIDVDDALDPESAAASGVVLPRLLWFRCRDRDARRKGKPWSRLEQALKATDLLLQASGFGAIVLDLGDTDSGHARRIPLATWFRFRQAAHRARTSLVLLGQDSYAHSAAEVILECTAAGRTQHPDITEPGQTVLGGLRFEVHRHRQRTPQPLSARKPPASTWSAGSAWNVVKSA